MLAELGFFVLVDLRFFFFFFGVVYGVLSDG